MGKDVGIALTAALAAWTFCVQPAVAGSAVVFDYQDGHVLYAEDIDAPWYPASLTKMMTAYLVLSAIRDKRVSKDTKVFISPAAFKQPPTRLGFKVGKDITMDEALRALIMRSANDVAVAIAETLGGDEASFVKQMNQTAARLGMSHSHFINPNGLPADQQVTTARDMGLLSQALLRDFPEETGLYALTQTTIGKAVIGTHNALLTGFPGGDGIKTGYTCASGYNLAASATRDGRKLIAIVLGAGWWAIAGFLLTYNVIRVWTGYWALQTGMASGMRVGAAIGGSWLPRAIERVSPAAGFILGAALPVLAKWYLLDFGWGGVVGAAGVAVAGFALTRWFGPGLTTVRFALMAMLLLLLFRGLGL